MKLWMLLLSLTIVLGGACELIAQEGGFLTDGEADAIRETAQQPDKRVGAYLDFAKRRLDAVRANLAAGKPGAGQAVQRNLANYNHILQAIDDTIEDARNQRAPISKTLKKTSERDAQFLKYLQSINSESSPGWKDYQFTLDEAVTSTQDQLNSASKGEFPEAKERKPPTDLPAFPPPQQPQGGTSQQGSPRKSSAQP